jgi:hypothetical protein
MRKNETNRMRRNPSGLVVLTPPAVIVVEPLNCASFR